MKYLHGFVGELIGTFLLVLFGCGSIAVTILFSAYVGLLQVALIWGMGLTLTVIIAIFGPLTQAGLNPARALAPRLGAYFAGWGKATFPDRGFGFLSVYVLGSLVGAGVAAAVFSWIVEPLMKDKGKKSNSCA